MAALALVACKKRAPEVKATEPPLAGIADLDGAVKELARLAGASAKPLEGMNNDGESVPTGGFVVPVPEKRVDEILASAHAAFLAKGYYLFRHDRNFGISGPDMMGILPTRDPFEVMAKVGVNGINYDKDNAAIITGMKTIAASEPFVITGVGFDFVEGRFTTPIEDPAGLAKALYAFCPDVVDQGVGSLAALEKELRHGAPFFLWWD